MKRQCMATQLAQQRFPIEWVKVTCAFCLFSAAVVLFQFTLFWLHFIMTLGTVLHIWLFYLTLHSNYTQISYNTLNLTPAGYSDLIITYSTGLIIRQMQLTNNFRCRTMLAYFKNVCYLVPIDPHLIYLSNLTKGQDHYHINKLTNLTSSNGNLIMSWFPMYT